MGTGSYLHHTCRTKQTGRPCIGNSSNFSYSGIAGSNDNPLSLLHRCRNTWRDNNVLLCRAVSPYDSEIQRISIIKTAGSVVWPGEARRQSIVFASRNPQRNGIRRIPILKLRLAVELLNKEAHHRDVMGFFNLIPGRHSYKILQISNYRDLRPATTSPCRCSYQAALCTHTGYKWYVSCTLGWHT